VGRFNPDAAGVGSTSHKHVGAANQSAYDCWRFLPYKQLVTLVKFDIDRAVRPDAAAIKTAPEMSNRQIVARLLEGAGRRVLDVGCGRGQFTRVLAEFFSDVSGVDPRPDLIAKAQDDAREAGTTVNFREGVAEDLPFDAAAFDVVTFSNSLHHFADFAAAFGEARRVLVAGGLLHVMEPVAAGNYFEVTRLVHEEVEVRRAAYEAMACADGWMLLDELTYRRRVSFASFEEWKMHTIETDAKRRNAFDRAEARIRDRFESQAERQDGRFFLDHLLRVDLLRRL